MKNFVQEGKILRLDCGGAKSAGDPVVVGTIAGVCVTDTDSNDFAEVRVDGVCSLSVKGEDDAGNAAIADGAKIYLDGAVLNADSVNGVLFGKLVNGAVASGATETENVLLIQA